ncbi:TIGR02302 family protein [Aureimonas sp. AU12]|uniref:TIGR02302 family protein n=1 Tax=Aureimonas sp. AU12 TaxID=1638161 RepID=UPI0007862A07|nr:TIGR02302 family protein [Aureimonas sp. AU12]
MAPDSPRLDDLPAGRPAPAGPRRVRVFAYAAILVERVWPTLLGLALVGALFLILSWFGAFAALPPLARLGLLALLVVGLCAVLWRARRLHLPRPAEVVERIERASQLQHQPLQAQADRPAGGDAFAQALWREHQRRMAERLRHLTGGAPRTRTYAVDPWGLRALVAVLLVTGFAFSFGPRGGRVTDALTQVADALPVGVRVDAWATPPGYTGRAPIFLTEAQGGPVPGGRLDVPEGTILSLRISDRRGAAVRYTPEGGTATEIAPVASEAVEGAPPVSTTTEAAAPEGPLPGEYELPLTASGSVAVDIGLRSPDAWTFAVTPDEAPRIAFDGTPKLGRNGALDIAYLASDDYGVAAGEAKIAVRDAQAPGARALIAPPQINLALPRRTKGEAKGRTSVDIAESPYAGAKVAMTLEVRDDADQIGTSTPLELILPERRFADPLARAVVEQRRILALDANAAGRVVDMLDAVTLRGDEFIANPSDYLALRAVRERIAGTRDDETLISAVDFLWQIALGIEDGDLSVSEKRLRDAQENLSEALKNGASDEEIAKLTQELREAMQEFMQAMAEAMRNMPPQSQAEMGDMQEIRPQDLERMLDKIEDLARSGSKDAAQQLLSELKDMMSSLQAMRPGQQQQQQQGQQSPMQQQMNQLGEMLQRQQSLMDQTFEMGRQQMRRQMEAEREMDGTEGGEPRPGEEPGQQGQQQGQPGQQPPMTAEQLQALKERLQAEQSQLQKDLQALQEAMQGQGMKPSEDLGQAGQSMGRAEGAIGEGNDGEAVGQQGEAMDALRRGARDAMQQMQAMQGQGQQPGQGQGQQGQQPGQGQLGEGYGPGQQRSGRDPLGRERQTQGPDFGRDVGVPDEIDIQRARRILDQIRDKLGHQLSPQQERDYLERLLKTP